mgnify:FL=1
MVLQQMMTTIQVAKLFGAETPEEIAISIAAEMIEHRARLAGQRH